MINIMHELKYSVAVKILLCVALFGFILINIATKAKANSDVTTDPKAKTGANSSVITDPKMLTVLYMLGNNVVYNGDDFAFIALDPRHSKVIYIATEAGALYKSVNGGKKWNPVNNKFGVTRYGNLAIDPNDTAVMYANAFMINADEDIGGIMKSTNSGLDWHLLLELEDFLDYSANVLIDPNNSSTVYVGGEGCIYKSTDAGLNWEKIFKDTDPSVPIIVLDISRQKPSILYAGITGRDYFRIMKSTDSGQTWIDINNGMDDDVIYIENTAVSRHLISFEKIAVSRHDPNTIYALFARRLYKSTDAGKSWKELKQSPYQEYDALHLDILLTNDPNIIYLNTYEKGLYRSANGGESWKKTHRNEKDRIPMDFIAIDPKNHRVIYAGDYERLYKSTNSGRTWKTILNRPLKF